MSSMAYIDRERLKTDLEYRVAFSRDFIEFTDDDVAVLQGVAPLMLPVRPASSSRGTCGGADGCCWRLTSGINDHCR